MAFKNIQRNKTSDMVIDQIKDQIKNGELLEGNKLPPERELAEMTGVSRTSVREAIQALSFAGYLESIQGRGTFVSKNAKKYDEISDLLIKTSEYSFSSLIEVREMLEGETVKLASLRATEEEQKEIIKAFNKMKQAKTIREFVREDLNFHLCISNATHNPLMKTLMKVFGDILHKETNKIIKHSLETREETIKITQKIVEAIINREDIKAKELMIKHVKVLKINEK